MQPPEMDKKREAFLEHLKQKYPHHASAIMGHQERLREQSRSPKHGPSPQPSVCDQVDHLSLASLESLDTMSDVDAPSAFTRGSRVRASLPVVRSTNQTKDRSLGVLYLQYGDETKQIRMPNEITSGDTVRALFVGAFPQQLTMKMLESPSVAVYVKDDMRNMYYELTDVRNITDHSCLKVYHKDPAQAFSHGPPRPTNGDARMHREMMYGPAPHPHRQPPVGPPPHHPMQGSMSPPMPHSMPPSPSRIPFGPRQGSVPGSATMPRDRMPSANPPARSVSPCPSAILERRDVKPDEDMGGKSHSLTRGNEALYADPYLLQESRMAMASAHGPHPPPPGGLDGPEHGLGGYHRASIRSTGSSGYSGPSPTDTMDHPSLYRQKSRNSQLPTLGSKTPPPSPHRMTEMRMIDIHGGGPPHGGPPHGGPPHSGPPHGGPPHGMPPHAVPLERCSPVRQSFRKEEGAGGAKPRNNAGPSPPVGDLQGHVPGGPVPQANDPQTRERMRAMEQQIASLTGLVQHALLKGPNSSGTKEPLSDRPPKTSSPAHSAHSAHSSGGSPVLAPKSSAAPLERGPVPLQVNLMHCKRNVSDLRLQLQQMRQLQLHNQEALRVQLKHTEQEISVKLAEAMRRVEDPVQRQRALVEEDRHKYLGLEERVLTQLGDLEQFVDSLKRDSGGINRAVTLKDVEEGAVTLRKVGESLAGLKGEFPALQTRMRAVLRVEVEAVKFLKEEPHKLDTMLKRVKSLTETLSSLRRCATEINQKTSSDQPTNVSLKAAPVETGPTTVASESGPHVVDAPPASGQPEPQTSTLRSEVMPSSPVVIHHVQSSPVHMQQCQQSAALTTQPSPPLTPSPTQGAPSPSPGPPGQSQGRDSPKGADASDPPSPARNKKAPVSPVNSGSQNLVIEELQSSQGKGKSRAMSIEAAEREWEEKRQNMGHYDGKEFAKILQEAQVNMMKGIPSLDMEDKSTVPPAATGDQTDSPKHVETPSDEPQSSPTAEKPAKQVPEKPPKPVLEKPVKPILERPTKASAERPPTTKPAVSSEKLTKLGSEKASKSPPPPPPRKTYPSSNSGMTTTRSGEVVFTSRKDSLSAQEGEEEGPPPSPQPKPAKAPAETLPKSPTPPPVTASAVTEEEDEGDKIMAELQVFQKCSVKDVGVKNVADPATTRIEPQIRELRPGALLPLKEKKSSEPSREDKEPNIDENGNTTVRQSQGVIYYVTGQISKDQPQPPPGTEETPERREPTLPPSQVSNVNANDNSPGQQQPLSDPPVSPPPLSPPPISPPPISPKPVGLNGFKLPRKHMKRSQPSKTGTEAAGANTILNQINAEKKREPSVTQEHISSSKSVVTEKVSISTTSTIREAPKSVAPLPEEAPCDGGEQASGQLEESGDEDAGLSADLPGEEAPPPPDNIAFMITSTKVQALSCGEYQELVNAKKGSVQTVTVGNRGNATEIIDPSAPPDNGFNRKPVIIIFDEPMDIRSAYKRLSTIFESEEELERMLAEERIDEESEESDSERSGGTQVIVGGPKGGDDGSAKAVGRRVAADRASLSSSSSSSSVSELTEGGANSETTGDAKQDGKKKFKFKFPKKQLAALSQAIRAGTKSGKKTLQVVVYEDEEESDGTVRQHKEAKRFEIVRSKSLAAPSSAPAKRDNSDSLYRTDEIRKSTYKTLDSLEQTIKQLETTISEMGPCPEQEPPYVRAEETKAGDDNASEGVGLKRSLSLPSSKSPGSKICLPSKSSLRKKSKPQLLPRPVVVPTTTTSTPSPPSGIQQNASVASPTSRMPVPLSAKSRQSPGTTDKAGKQQKLQDAQRQFRQANGSAKRVGGDHKTTSPTVPVSKIPAFYTSSSKGSSQPAQNSDATNPINPSFSSSSPSPSPSSSSTTKSSLPSPYAPRSVSSHIPSLSNGSLKLPTPSQHTGKTLSFSSQTQNGRAHSSSSSSSFSSSSSSSPSPLSPTPLGPGGKSIRTIHTPSFTSYRPHNGAGGKSCIPTATAAKDTN